MSAELGLSITSLVLTAGALLWIWFQGRDLERFKVRCVHPASAFCVASLKTLPLVVGDGLRAAKSPAQKQGCSD